MQQTLSVIVPVYNEQDNLEDSVLEILKAAKEANILAEIIIVDDGSSDDSWEIANSIQKQYERIRCYRNKYNLGLGGAYKKGLENVSMGYVSWVPSDCSHNSASLLEAFQAIGEADIIIPVPQNPEVRTLSRRIISKTFTLIINITSGLNILYYNGLSIYKSEILKKVEIESTGFGFQAEVMVKALKKVLHINM